MTEQDLAPYIPADLAPLIPYIYGVGVALLITWIFWALYVFAMGLYRAKLDGRLGGINYYMGLPIFLFAYLLDIVFNFTIAALLFLDPPRETLVTSRLQRYMSGRDGWRKTIAEFICTHLLDPFDPHGDHC